MTKLLKNDLVSLLNSIDQNPSKHPYISDVYGYIEEMLRCFDGDTLRDKDNLEKLSSDLFRLITDDYEFYKSETGTKISEVIDKI